jgi:hypothetical protein
MERKGGHEMVFPRVQTGKADPGDGDEAGFLWQHLHIAE